MAPHSPPLLDVHGLETRFRVRRGHVYAVNGVSFQLRTGETLGIVGESGCGKSVTMLSLLQLLPRAARVVAGQAIFNDRDLLRMSAREMRRVRGAKISMIFQDPLTSLNPVINIGEQIAESLVYHQNLSKRQALARSEELLTLVGIPDAGRRLRDYPYQLSGGMRQRVMIAMAIACRPAVLIADEPTTALDVTIQAQILALVKDLRDQVGVAVIWISHDLGVIADIADRVLVMYAGYIVEEAPIYTLFDSPCHPYTVGLIGSMPSALPEGQARLTTIGGAPPDLAAKPAFCPFLPRCRHAVDRCRRENPPLMDVPGSAHHRVACWVGIEQRPSL